MHFDILTLFPDFFTAPNSLLKETVLGRAIKRDIFSVSATNIRDFAIDKHHTTDDSPYGGGPGMVMKVEPIVGAIEEVRGEASGSTKVILMTPQGTAFTQKVAHELSKLDRVIIVCGRYEGVDERVRSFVDMELSIGDYVLTGGEAAALVVVDAVARLLPGVITAESLDRESFSEDGLEYPQYTRPEEFRGMRVPELLTNGNHAEIERWRSVESNKRTNERRPELLNKKK